MRQVIKLWLRLWLWLIVLGFSIDINFHTNVLKFRIHFKKAFGGVTALTPSQIQSTRGYSNRYFGWGQEDSEQFHRYWLILRLFHSLIINENLVWDLV